MNLKLRRIARLEAKVPPRASDTEKKAWRDRLVRAMTEVELDRCMELLKRLKEIPEGAWPSCPEYGAYRAICEAAAKRLTP